MVQSTSRSLRLGALVCLALFACRADDPNKPAELSPTTPSHPPTTQKTHQDQPPWAEAVEPSTGGPSSPTTTAPTGTSEIFGDPTPAVNPSETTASSQPIVIDGSSTVFPISEAVVEEFERRNPSTPVRLGVSGTGGGFQKFCRRDIDIADASRPIKAAEAEICRQNGVELIELPVAFDGISVVVHAQNDWSPCVTVGELKRLWAPPSQGRLRQWNELRPDWPEKPITLFGPGKDSGTFDYFTRAIVGKEGDGRDDFNASEDDYLLAQGVARDPFSLGFFGYAYYQEYRDRLRLVAIDAGAGCVSPSEQTIARGSYRPLSRPVFIYVRLASLERASVRDFVRLYLERVPLTAPKLGYVALPARAYNLAQRRVEQRTLGSLFDGGSQVGMSIEQLLELELGDG